MVSSKRNNKNSTGSRYSFTFSCKFFI